MELSENLALPEDAVLLFELNHRINNEFASAISVVSRAAARSSNNEVRLALTDVTELLNRYADVHRALQAPELNTTIDVAAYLKRLCLSLGRSKLDHLAIDLVLAACPLRLQSGQCWRLGMIVNELVTNTARHAFSGQKGSIRVELVRAGSFVTCKVQDNGASPREIREGRGLHIVRNLAKALNGHFEQRYGSRGSVFMLAFPYGADAS
jgi:two-component sensor histidine kinase